MNGKKRDGIRSVVESVRSSVGDRAVRRTDEALDGRGYDLDSMGGGLNRGSVSCDSGVGDYDYEVTVGLYSGGNHVTYDVELGPNMRALADKPGNERTNDDYAVLFGGFDRFVSRRVFEALVPELEKFDAAAASTIEAAIAAASAEFDEVLGSRGAEAAAQLYFTAESRSPRPKKTESAAGFLADRLERAAGLVRQFDSGNAGVAEELLGALAGLNIRIRAMMDRVKGNESRSPKRESLTATTVDAHFDVRVYASTREEAEAALAAVSKRTVYKTLPLAKAAGSAWSFVVRDVVAISAAGAEKDVKSWFAGMGESRVRIKAEREAKGDNPFALMLDDEDSKEQKAERDEATKTIKAEVQKVADAVLKMYPGKSDDADGRVNTLMTNIFYGFLHQYAKISDAVDAYGNNHRAVFRVMKSVSDTLRKLPDYLGIGDTQTDEAIAMHLSSLLPGKYNED